MALTLKQALREIFYAIGQGYRITTLFQIRVTFEKDGQKMDFVSFEDEMTIVHTLIDLCAKYINKKQDLFLSESARVTHAAIMEQIPMLELRRGTRQGFLPSSLDEFYKYVLFLLVRVEDKDLSTAFARPLDTFVALAQGGQRNVALLHTTLIQGRTVLIDSGGK